MIAFLMLVAIGCLLMSLAGPPTSTETTVVVRSHAPNAWMFFLSLLAMILLLLLWRYDK